MCLQRSRLVLKEKKLLEVQLNETMKEDNLKKK